MGARRVRFFSTHVRDRANGARFRHERRRSELRDHHHAGDAPGGRVYLRSARRPLWATDSADDRYHFLFADGIAHGVFAELHCAADFPRALWGRHGRRVGIGRVAGNGNIANSSTRTVFGNFAAGLHVWLPVRRSGLWDCLPDFWVARIVCGWRAAGGVGHLHSRQSSGIACMVTTRFGRELLVDRGRHPEAPLAVVHLCHFAYDRV